MCSAGKYLLEFIRLRIQIKTGLSFRRGAVGFAHPEEIRKGIIPGAAVHIDYFNLDFEKQVAELDLRKTYFLYCAVGGRSGETLELMKKLGFKEVYNLERGFHRMAKAQIPHKTAQKVAAYRS